MDYIRESNKIFNTDSLKPAGELHVVHPANQPVFEI